MGDHEAAAPRKALGLARLLGVGEEFVFFAAVLEWVTAARLAFSFVPRRRQT